MRFLPAILPAVFLAIWSGPVVGQAPPPRMPLDSGTLIRVTLSSGSKLAGRLLQRVGSSSESPWVCRYPGRPCVDTADSAVAQRIALASAARIDVQRGNHLATGAIIGGLIGGSLGGLVGGFRSLCDAADCGPPASQYTWVGILSGALFGALFGLASPSWTRLQ